MLQLPDVNVESCRRICTLVATRRQEGFDILDPAQPEAVKNAPCGGQKNAGVGYDPVAVPSLASQGFDPTNGELQSGIVQLVRTGRAALQTSDAFCPEAYDPPGYGLWADAGGYGRSFQYLPVLQHAAHNTPQL